MALLPEYLDNLRALLRTDVGRWKLIVERQVQSQVLPRVSGTRATLEPHLWELLVLCLDGHETTALELDDGRWEAALQAATDGRGLANDGPAAFPRAAARVATLMAELREFGVYPPPRV